MFYGSLILFALGLDAVVPLAPPVDYTGSCLADVSPVDSIVDVTAVDGITDVTPVDMIRVVR